MSRTAATVSMHVTNGATWEDEFVYTDDAGVGIDLTGYAARMQVRTAVGQYGTTTATTLLMELTTANGRLAIDTPTGQTVPCRVKIVVDSDDTALLNADNVRRVKHVYALEVYDDSVSPEYVIPLATGRVVVLGETVR